MDSTSSSKHSTNNSKPAMLTWEINNFANLNSQVKSQKFSFANDDKLRFSLYLYPKNANAFLEAMLYYGNLFHNMCGQINFWNQYLQNLENGLLVNGKLTIYCEVNKIDNNNEPVIISEINSSQEKSSKIAEDLNSLLESENFSDAVLVVGEKEFRVHKAILAARSAVFKAMFEHDCEEKKQNRVEIVDLDVEVCEEFLRYIYTGNVIQLDRFAPELMATADKYQLDDLKSICEQFMCKSLDINSVATVLQLADMHNVDQLKSKCIEYIVNNAKQVQATEGWKKLFIAMPELGLQLFLKLADKS